MMTPGAAILTAILTRIGAVLYAAASGRSHTKKVARYSLPAGNPLVLEVDRKVPNLWMRPISGCARSTNAACFISSAKPSCMRRDADGTATCDKFGSSRVASWSKSRSHV